MTNDTSSRLKIYNRIAKFYDFLDYLFEIYRYRPIRKKILARTLGEILEVGIGTGRNLEFYPKNAKITGIDISESMLDRTRKRALNQKRKVSLKKMNAEKLEFPDNHFDTIVATFLFCVLPNPLPALLEISRVCKPNGKIILLEYTPSKKFFKKISQKFWTPIAHWLYGATFDRNTSEVMKKNGFEIIEERFVSSDILKLIISKPK